MKNINFLMILFALAAFSTACKDECKDVVCLNGGQCVEGTCDCPVGYVGEKCDEKVSFNVTGVRDTIVYVNETTEVPLRVVWGEGPKETVNLEVTGLPANISAEIVPNTGTPDFNALLKLTGGPNATTGNFDNLSLDASIASGLKISRNFNISVQNNCRPFLVGFYDVSEACATGNWDYTSQIKLDPLVSNRLLIDDFAKAGLNVYLVVDCDGKTLTIPSQTLTGATVSGTGSFDIQNETIVINYQIKYSATTETCSATYIKL